MMLRLLLKYFGLFIFGLGLSMITGGVDRWPDSNSESHRNKEKSEMQQLRRITEL